WAESAEPCATCCEDAQRMAMEFLAQLPAIRDLLAGDVKAAYEGDPAAKTPGETIFCYPSLVAMTNHRIAHALYSLNVPLIPRIISEMAHSVTGIDIHPGARIGAEFFIDHGTGVVIGETSIIGERCRLYQGVTLGALSFVADTTGALVKGQPRHPILEDNVTVYAGATILGRVVIGRNSIIGGNVWLTHGVPPDSRVVQQQSVDSGVTTPMRGEECPGVPMA
ncbi:MAG: serine acetyltransferase, partial [Desulfovibrio sp.]|nr:serine acetyltransferase [Desulfovibrio sp.]